MHISYVIMYATYTQHTYYIYIHTYIHVYMYTYINQEYRLYYIWSIHTYTYICNLGENWSFTIMVYEVDTEMLLVFKIQTYYVSLFWKKKWEYTNTQHSCPMILSPNSQWLGLGQAATGNWKSNPCLPCEWQGLKNLSYHVLKPIARSLNWERYWVLNQALWYGLQVSQSAC